MGSTVEPYACCLVESLRAFGYSFEAAVADIIDNSIYAGAKTINIDFDWNGADTIFSITDNGCGMDSSELVNAMRPGTKSPVEKRNEKDLGRFGLGLKTASFSQCRKLIVASKKNNSCSVKAWDLDEVCKKNEWYLLDEGDIPNVDYYLKNLTGICSGTTVFWENIDRACMDLEANSDKHHSKFLELIEHLGFHLRLTFHRFLEQKNGPSIILNGRKILPWDPFMSSHKATQSKKCHIDYKNIHITPIVYILPHHSKLSEEEYKIGQGVRGWNDYQGFYVYRNKRLLIAGDWLGLGGAKEEHAKLARIQIDLPNTLDHDWQIDVKKSKASPPAILKEELKNIAQKARGEATQIYRHRGKILNRSESPNNIVCIWNRIKRQGKYHFKLNLEYPIISKMLNSLPSNLKKDFRAILRLVGETVPSPAIAVTHSEEPDAIGKPYSGCLKELTMLGVSLYSEMQKAGNSRKNILRKLATLEPFDSYPELIDMIEQEVKHVK
ncbi:MAG: ATP-binding protein [Bacteroidales bacterium]|nr:ATP-binding protein [Bacteroidales bacterium]